MKVFPYSVYLEFLLIKNIGFYKEIWLSFESSNHANSHKSKLIFITGQECKYLMNSGRQLIRLRIVLKDLVPLLKSSLQDLLTYNAITVLSYSPKIHGNWITWTIRTCHRNFHYLSWRDELHLFEYQLSQNIISLLFRKNFMVDIRDRFEGDIWGSGHFSIPPSSADFNHFLSKCAKIMMN